MKNFAMKNFAMTMALALVFGMGFINGIVAVSHVTTTSATPATSYYSSPNIKSPDRPTYGSTVRQIDRELVPSLRATNTGLNAGWITDYVYFQKPKTTGPIAGETDDTIERAPSPEMLTTRPAPNLGMLVTLAAPNPGGL